MSRGNRARASRRAVARPARVAHGARSGGALPPRTASTSRPLAARARALARELGGKVKTNGGRSRDDVRSPVAACCCSPRCRSGGGGAAKRLNAARRRADERRARPRWGRSSDSGSPGCRCRLRSLCLGCVDHRGRGAAPRLGARELRSEGISIVLAVDISSSMLAEDFSPGEPARCRAPHRDRVRARALVRSHRAGGLRGAGAHAGADHHRLPGARGSDPPAARRDSRRRHRDRHRDRDEREPAAPRARQEQGRGPADRRREQQRHRRSAHRLAQAAATFGIRIYTIGVGTQGEAPVPTGQGPARPPLRDHARKDRRAAAQRSRAHHGGRYFRATDAASLSNIFGEINRLEKTPGAASRVSPLRGGVSLAARASDCWRSALELVIAGTFAVRVP
mgnify:CR=1 FL=1